MSNALCLAALLLSGGAGMASAQCTNLLNAVLENELTSLAAAVTGALDNAIAGQLSPLATTAVELPGEDKFTIFAPSDAAFEALGVLPTGDELATLLVNHVAQGYFPSTTINAELQGETLDDPGAAITTLLEGQTLTIRQDGMAPPGIYVTAEGQEAPGAKVITADIETCIGVIHIVDMVLVAGAEGAVTPSEAPPVLESGAPSAAPAAGTPRCDPDLFGDSPGPAGVDYDYDDSNLMPGMAPAPAPAPGPDDSASVATGDDAAAVDSTTREAGDVVGTDTSSTVALGGHLVAATAVGLLALWC